jgi:hypothetical protein
MPGCESPLAAYVLDQDGSATLFLAGELDMASGARVGPVDRRGRTCSAGGGYPRRMRSDLCQHRRARALLTDKHAVTSVDAKFRLLSVGDLTHRVIRIVHFDGLEDATETV